MADKKQTAAVKKSESAGKSSAKKKSTMSKSHIIISLLASFASAFSFFIVGPLGFFFSKENRSFFEDNGVYARMIVPLMIIAAAVYFVILAAILLLATGKVHTVIVSVITWIMVAGYIQVLFFNGWTQGLLGDGNFHTPLPGLGIPNLLLWIVLGVIIVGAPLLSKGKLAKISGIAKMVVIYLLVLVFAMQGAGLLEVVLNTPEEKKSSAFLSTENIFDVSTSDNVVVFVIDRFDQEYFYELLEYDPDFFKDYDGFTAYVDNVSLYARTYPAVTSMLTGKENDFTKTKDEYFKEAYTESTFLKDMSAGGYNLNIYAPKWYVYDNANDMGNIKNAIDAGDTARLDNPMGLLGAMVSYSLYNYCPDLLKYATGVSTNNFVGHTSHSDEYEEYIIDDAVLFDKFENEGISTTGNKNFSFIHMRGCHSPFNIDENGNTKLTATSLEQTRGVFKFIGEYIAELKAKGVYENSTIIITGDHASAVNDSKDVGNARITSLLVKEKGQSGTTLKINEAPVSQANLIPTIIKSSGVTPSVDYGKSYSEVKVGDDVVRKHLFQKTVDSDKADEIVEYEIKGSARDFANWSLKERHVIGKIYK